MILVTGGSGYIGSHLVSRLVADGERVRVFGRCSRKHAAAMTALRDKVEVHEGDLRDELAVSRAIADVTLVYHLGAISTSAADACILREMVDVNVSGTLNVLIAAHEAGVHRVVFASSSAVYGDSAVSPKSEETPTDPKSPYGMSKLTGEQLCGFFHRVQGLETVVLRSFNVYGPDQPADTRFPLVIPKFLHALRNGEPITLHGGGHQTRDFVYIDDVVTAMVRAGHAPAAGGFTLNVGSGQPTSIRAVLAQMAQIVRVAPVVRDEPARPGDILESVADIAAARGVLGYEPSVPFDEGLRRSIEPLSAPVYVGLATGSALNQHAWGGAS
ncbi:MAG: SDR family NAD(P)-dependent oxidoreductase [Thermomicrobiales bacterium]